MDPEKPDDPIFPKLAGRKTHKMLRRDLEAASIPYVTENGKFHDLHSLRHAYITRLWNAGATPVVARTMARHSDLRETMRYSHTNRNEERKIADRIGSFLEHPEPDS
jgi:site-specific recombinase XerD